MKRIFIILSIVLGLFIAMPIAASPPGLAVSNEIVANIPALVAPALVAPALVAPALVAPALVAPALLFQNVIGEFVTPIILASIVVIMLAGLMSRTPFLSNDLNPNYNPRDRFQALARDQCSSTT